MNSKIPLLLIFLIGFLSVNAQTSLTSNSGIKIIIKNGKIISLDDIDLTAYDLEFDEDEFDLKTLQREHLLYLAASLCDENLLLKVLQKKVDVNTRIQEGDQLITEIAYCLDNGVRLTEILLQYGVDINGSDAQYDTFLSYAIGYDNLDLVQYLIEKGADQSLIDNNPNIGCPPLMSCRSLKMIRLLHASDFDLNVRCKNGKTLLHYAAANNLLPVAKYLRLNNLIDKDLKDNEGKTALDYAKRTENRVLMGVVR